MGRTRMKFVALVSVLALCYVADATSVKGAINLDSFTFDKIVGGDAHVLVKFNKDYAYGDKEDAFKELAKRIGEAGANDMLVATVGVQEYGDKLNEDLSTRFSVKKDDFPVYKLFKKGSTTPVDYKGEVKADELTRFLKTEAGLYLALPGCLQAFDEFAQKFASQSDARDATKAAAEAAASGLTKAAEQESAKYYVLVMKKISEKGDGFVDSEIKRLTKISSGNITPEKKELFKKRLNILPSFKVTEKKEL